MRITNKLNLPDGFVRACTTERHNKPGELSATTLLKGVKEIILTERHWDEIEVDVSDQVWAIWGTAVHALLEHEGENEFTEERLTAEVNGITITGRIDNYNMATGAIVDYKTASVWKVKFNDFDDWRKQGLIYAWLLMQNGLPIKKCRFVALLKDHSQTEAERDASYPQSPVFVYDFDVSEQLLIDVGVHINSLTLCYNEDRLLKDDEIEPCLPRERWERGGKYAVMKKGRKKALKLFDHKGDAWDWKDKQKEYKKLYVEHRPGEPTKCAKYCNVNKWCHFWREYANTNS